MMSYLSFLFLELSELSSHFETDIYGGRKENPTPFYYWKGAVLAQLEQMDPGFYRLRRFSRELMIRLRSLSGIFIIFDGKTGYSEFSFETGLQSDLLLDPVRQRFHCVCRQSAGD